MENCSSGPIPSNRFSEEPEASFQSASLNDLNQLTLNFEAANTSIPIESSEGEKVYISPSAAPLLLALLEASPTAKVSIYNHGGWEVHAPVDTTPAQLRRLIGLEDEPL